MQRAANMRCPVMQPEPAHALSPQAPRKRKRLVKLRGASSPCVVCVCTVPSCSKITPECCKNTETASTDSTLSICPESMVCHVSLMLLWLQDRLTPHLMIQPFMRGLSLQTFLMQRPRSPAPAL